MLNEQEIKEERFLEVELSPNRNHVGLWKITGVEKRQFEDENIIHIELDRNTSLRGDEIFVDFLPETDNRDIYMLEKFQSFPMSEADEMPPPPVIEIHDVVYESIDDQVDEETGRHDGFELRAGESTYQIWIYEDESGETMLQIILDLGYLSMYRGYRLNSAFVNII